MAELGHDGNGIAWRLPWEAPEATFMADVREMVRRCHKLDKALSLPIPLICGEQIPLLVSMVDCRGCAAPCCRRGEPISLLAWEADVFKARGALVQPSLVAEWESLAPLPCRFLKGNRCSIYDVRPFACVCYPFQAGGTDADGTPVLGVSTACPQTVAERIYRAAWAFRRRLDTMRQYPDLVMTFQRGKVAL